ncbi:MAG: hypothetical protein IJT51_03695 [Bacteroidales bacterium]|nr:hypothetical protein [Bacteroidales bacterium]
MKHNPSPTLIIVPDIHGRTFWKKIFDYDSDVVFLGDYLDPYRSEGIYPWDALENFTQIIAYAKASRTSSRLSATHRWHRACSTLRMNAACTMLMPAGASALTRKGMCRN